MSGIENMEDFAAGTGILNGRTPLSYDEVEEYLTVENLEDMFPGEENPTQDELDELATWMIINDFYCNETGEDEDDDED